jgi:uncharacterized protein YaiE (UPF0345 family)
MAMSEPYELDGVSISTTEISVISGTSSLSNATTAGVYYPTIDPVQAAVAKGDRFWFRVYEKVRSASTKRVLMEVPIYNAQAEPWFFPPMMLLNGFDFTLQKTAGTDRNWDASIRASVGSFITEEYTYNTSTSTTELSITGGTSTIQAQTGGGWRQLFVDASAMAKGDVFEIAYYEKIEATGGTQRKCIIGRLTGAQSTIWVSPILPLLNGWDFSIKKISGTDRTIEASVRKAA